MHDCASHEVGFGEGWLEAREPAHRDHVVSVAEGEGCTAGVVNADVASRRGSWSRRRVHDAQRQDAGEPLSDGNRVVTRSVVGNDDLAVTARYLCDETVKLRSEEL